MVVILMRGEKCGDVELTFTYGTATQSHTKFCYNFSLH